MAADVEGTFQAFMDTQMDSNGKVRVGVLNGSGLLGLESEGRLVDANTAESWECGGADITGEIDLAFKLWLEGFAPFRTMVSKHGIGPTFSAIAFWDSKRASLNSLLRVAELLTTMLMASCDAFRDEAISNARHAHSRNKQNKGLEPISNSL